MAEIVLSLWEFVGLVVLAAGVVVLLFIILYEYRVWRTKRLVRVAAPRGIGRSHSS